MIPTPKDIEDLKYILENKEAIIELIERAKKPFPKIIFGIEEIGPLPSSKTFAGMEGEVGQMTMQSRQSSVPQAAPLTPRTTPTQPTAPGRRVAPKRTPVKPGAGIYVKTGGVVVETVPKKEALQWKKIYYKDKDGNRVTLINPVVLPYFFPRSVDVKVPKIKIEPFKITAPKVSTPAVPSIDFQRPKISISTIKPVSLPTVSISKPKSVPRVSLPSVPNVPDLAYTVPYPEKPTVTDITSVSSPNLSLPSIRFDGYSSAEDAIKAELRKSYPRLVADVIYYLSPAIQLLAKFLDKLKNKVDNAFSESNTKLSNWYKNTTNGVIDNIEGALDSVRKKIYEEQKSMWAETSRFVNRVNTMKNNIVSSVNSAMESMVRSVNNDVVNAVNIAISDLASFLREVKRGFNTT
ncbi:MAG: hypothetical protein ACTSUO_00155, partial [Candidatus Thorarchaeota archaeon]